MKLKSPLQLAFQGSYSKTQICIAGGAQIIGMREIEGTRSSKDLVPFIDNLLTENRLKLTDFDFFSVNIGPGAFTSLRVVVVTVNALGFGSGVKIMPVCGLDALFERSKDFFEGTQPDYVACLLNAYSGQVFVKVFGIEGQALPEFDSVCISLPEFCEKVKTILPDKKILFFGNGAKNFPDPTPNLIFDSNFMSIEPDAGSVASVADKLFSRGVEPQKKVVPNYIKKGFGT